MTMGLTPRDDEPWSLAKASTQLADALGATSSEAVQRAAQVKRLAEERNATARELCAQVGSALHRVRDTARPDAPLMLSLAQTAAAWRQEEGTLQESIDAVRRDLVQADRGCVETTREARTSITEAEDTVIVCGRQREALVESEQRIHEGMTVCEQMIQSAHDCAAEIRRLQRGFP